MSLSPSFGRSGLVFAGVMMAAQPTYPAAAPTNAVQESGAMALHSLPGARCSFGGVIGRRVEANLQGWLLPAPAANPGMIEIFHLRDRKPAPQLVPWAGEFAGKYLISAVQALRMTDSPALRSHLTNFVASLLAAQDEDGYLGPFPRAERLLGNWDLWGHYHIMEALLLWHEETGDPATLRACRRMADLICRTYLDQPRRVFDAGSHEMNMAVIHGLGMLYRLTGEPRYLRMMREVEKDWERAGDYLRAGLDGTEFYATPRPRWESLHDLQGLIELWRITGDPRYRHAFIHHWRSIARLDRHNTGAFSSGEQATGNPFAGGAIETCCTVAWMAMSVDMLRLTGDSTVADELELSTLNGGLGAQHPSGRWWTYNTPMDGAREASAHSIVFQARAGTPELNCCSVNGPRVLGLLSDWAVMADTNGLVVNWHGPGAYNLTLPVGTRLTLKCESSYPINGRIKWTVAGLTSARFPIRFRIPAWSGYTSVSLNGRRLAEAAPGRYIECDREWRNGDSVEIDLDLRWRWLMGDKEVAGYASLYRGPILLAFDQHHNHFDDAEIPGVDLKRLSSARVLPQPETNDALAPWLLLELDGARPLRLCDFASAGAAGTRYRSWLPVASAPPPSPITRAPADRATLGAGKTVFRWTTRTNAALADYRLVISESREFTGPAIESRDLKAARVEVDDTLKRQLQPNRWYYWRVIARGPGGETPSVEPAACFRFDPARPPSAERPEPPIGPDGLVINAPLHGDAQPVFGLLKHASAFEAAPGPDGTSQGAVRLNGRDQMLVYALPEAWEEDCSVAVWVRIQALPDKRIGQVFSAWAAGMDDPLRITVDQGKLFARVEAQQVYSTQGVPVATGQWHYVAVVKAGPRLTLYLDGQPKVEATVPRGINTQARACALGGNPNYSGNEFLAADFSGLTMVLRAFTPEEVGKLAAVR